MSYSTRKRAGGRLWPKFLAGFLVVVLLAGAGGVFYIRNEYINNLKPLSQSQKSQLVVIEQGSSAKQVAEQLEKEDVIRASWAFEWYLRNNKLRDKIQAGTYSLGPHLTVEEIAAILTKGSVATELVTIVPGHRIDQIRDVLINNGFKPDAVDSALDARLYEDHPALVDKPKNANLEGYLYPESFQKTAQTNPQTIIRASLDEMQKVLTPDIRAGIVKQGLTVHEGVVLASILEQEVRSGEDRAKAAQVFLKRLREDIPLQSDATAGYGAVIAGEEKSIFFKSPYNTYDNKGLTPGPISNVSKSSLQAVSQPATTDFLYFVSGDDGLTYFSKTAEEHEAAVRAHCKENCGL